MFYSHSFIDLWLFILMIYLSIVRGLVLDMLRQEHLFSNLKKCTFCTNKCVFLVFVVNAQGIQVEGEKVRTI